MRQLIVALCSASSLIGCSAAIAADLPARSAKPIEFVRVCGAYGAGFFYIPGTDTCLRLSGRARFEAGTVGAVFQRNSDLAQYRSLLRINVDARTETSYGTLRAFVRLEAASRTGGFLTSGTQQRIAQAFAATGQDTAGRVQQYVNTDKAFIQFGGLTAGRASSFYDFYAHDLELMGLSAGSDVGSTNLVAYTATVGNGFSATASMEDPAFRWQPVYRTTSGSPFLSPVINAVNPLTGLPSSLVNYDVVQRSRMPDFVGVVRYDDKWGSAQLSAAVHDVGIGNPVGSPFGTNGGVASTAATGRPETKLGWGVQAGVKFNLPFLADGDTLYLQGSYGEGAMSYTGFQQFTASYSQSSTPVDGAPFEQYLSDAVLNPSTGKLELSKSFTVVGSYLHYWSPQWRSSLFASYGELAFSKSARASLSTTGQVAALPSILTNPAGFALSPVLRDNNQLVAGTSLIWSPVRDLDIGAEGLYVRTGLNKGRTQDLSKPVSVAGVPVYTVSSQDSYMIRARVQRDF